MGEAKTRAGRLCRQHMLETAAKLIHRYGVHGTSIDRVLEASGTGKGQFYHYFGSKEQLVREVVRYHAERVFERNAPLLADIHDWNGLSAWFDELVLAAEKSGCVGGCPLGTLAAEMADQDDALRTELARSLRELEHGLAAALRRMQANGAIDTQADIDSLANFVVASQQGAILLAKTARDTSPLRNTLNHVLLYLRGFAARPSGTALH